MQLKSKCFNCGGKGVDGGGRGYGGINGNEENTIKIKSKINLKRFKCFRKWRHKSPYFWRIHTHSVGLLKAVYLTNI